MKELELFLSYIVCLDATVFVTIFESAKTNKNKNATKLCIQMTLAIHSGNFIQNLPIFYVKVVNRSYKCE